MKKNQLDFLTNKNDHHTVNLFDIELFNQACVL